MKLGLSDRSVLGLACHLEMEPSLHPAEQAAAVPPASWPAVSSPATLRDFQGERVIVSHVWSVLSSSSETAKQVALCMIMCIITEPIYKWGAWLKTPAWFTAALGKPAGVGAAICASRCLTPAWSLMANSSHVRFLHLGLPVTSCLTHYYVRFHSLLDCFLLTLSFEIIQISLKQWVIKTHIGKCRDHSSIQFLCLHLDAGVCKILEGYYSIIPNITGGVS